MKYQQHEKLNTVKDQSQAIGDFLEWLHSEKGIILAVPSGVSKFESLFP